MECVNMYNQDHHHNSMYQMAGPRISFSSDFSLECPSRSSNNLQTDPDFEFSVGSHQMIAADQLFSKGRILPMKNSSTSGQGMNRVTTLRDELREKDKEQRPTKAMKWKELLGLRKGGGSKKGEKSELPVVSEGSEVNFSRFSFSQEPGL
ncbi:hypothetical protein LUZ60_002720 [Juncus effusus]|nr:hypothetical protein LUZ60_002720 [Juncus effusus]